METRFSAAFWAIRGLSQCTKQDLTPIVAAVLVYIINGRDQRYLDRNLTVFGRVVAGMDVIQKVARGDRAIGSGVIPNAEDRTPILGMSIAADLPQAQRPHVEVMRSDSPAFAAEKEAKYYRDNDFFSRKPEVVEACAVTGPVRLANDE